MTFEDLGTTATVLLAIVGALLVAMNFVDKIRSWRKPTVDKDKLIEQKLLDHDGALNDNERRLLALEAQSTATIRALIAMIDHDITGNGIEKLKEVKEKLMDQL